MAINKGTITALIVGLVALVIAFNVLSSLLPEVQDAGDQLNKTNRCEAEGCYFNASANSTAFECITGVDDQTVCSDYKTVPLSGLLGTGGIVVLIIMAMFGVLIVKSYMNKK